MRCSDRNSSRTGKQTQAFSLLHRLPHIVQRRSVTSQRLTNRSAVGGQNGRSHDNDDKFQESKLGPNVIANVSDIKDGILKYSSATVMRNDAVNLEGTVRLIHLTISDPVDLLYGRKVKPVVEHSRWIDSFTLPGQFVCLRFSDTPEHAPPKRLFGIASSPYESKRDSAYVDGGIIEVVAERGCSEDDDRLAGLGPGSQLEVSQVIGRGFSSLFNSYVCLLSTLEESRNILIIAVGSNGMVPVRSALRWTPVQAHATAHQVTCLYVAQSASQAAFLSEWDTWRDAGVQFTPLYTSGSLSSVDDEGSGSASSSSEGDDSSTGASSGTGRSGTVSLLPPAKQLPTKLVQRMLADALFSDSSKLAGIIGCPASEVSVLLAGCSGELATTLTRKLVQRGVALERILYSDYF